MSEQRVFLVEQVEDHAAGRWFGAWPTLIAADAWLANEAPSYVNCPVIHEFVVGGTSFDSVQHDRSGPST